MRKSNFAVFFIVIAILGLIVFAALYFSHQQKNDKDADASLLEKDGKTAVVIQPEKALEMLKAGNRRYVTENRMKDPGVSRDVRRILLKGQAPFATILSCSDSRFPPEVFFDAGLGQLFVVRNAGNQLSSDTLGSMEYASLFSTSRLIVVMGHQSCGAVTEAVRLMRQPGQNVTPAINSLVCNLIPAVLIAGKQDVNISEEKLINDAAREHVRQVCRAILQSSEPLKKMAATGKLKITGAYADLESGKVEFFQP
ncbi:MAG: carbonic anhydrase [Victivallaceae bacterium]|jgi:carbonic anhydrase